VLAWARLTPGDAPDANDRLPLTLELAERPRRVIRLAGAFSSDEGLTVSTSWSHRNLLGGGERLTLTGDIGQIGGTEINALSYLVNTSLLLPDLWVRDLDLRLDLGAVKEDLDAYDREAVTAGLIFERRLSPELSAGAGVAFERSRISQDGPHRDYRLVSTPLTLRHDSTDETLDPRSGLRLAAQLTPTQVLEGQESGFVLARLAGSAYLDLGPGAADPKGPERLILAGRIVIGSIIGAAAEDIPPDWRFYAGGGGSVRGYPFQSIGPRTVSGSPAGGDGLLEPSLELRQRLSPDWGAVAFVDAGSVSRDSRPGTDSLAVGVGIGLRYFTPIGPVRADIATPLDRDVGGSPVQLYIGIGQAF
jgi:translocation and assembly module TamA